MVDKVTTMMVVHVNSSDLYKTGHMAARWFGTVSRRLSTFTKASAPKRSGRLRSGIHTKMHTIPQAREMTIDWRSEVLYTMFVLRGTTSPIMTDRGWNTTHGDEFPNGGEGTAWSWVPSKFGEDELFAQANPGYWMHFGGYGYPWTWRTHVEGQDPNNFLLRGWRKTAHFHRAMRRIPTFVLNP